MSSPFFYNTINNPKGNIMQNKLSAAKQAIKFRNLLAEIKEVLTPTVETLSSIKRNLGGPADIDNGDWSEGWGSAAKEHPVDGRYLSNLIKMETIPHMEAYDVSQMWERLITLFTCVALDSNKSPMSISRSTYEDNKAVFSLVQEELEHNELNKELFEIYNTELTEGTLRHLTATVAISLVDLINPKLRGSHRHLQSSLFEVLSMPYETIMAQGGYSDVELCTLIVALENQEKLDKLLKGGKVTY